MRVNARLDDDHSRKLEVLTRLTGSTVTDVLKRAIDLYYETLGRDRRRAAEVLEEQRFIGAAAGDPNLSETYKALLSDLVAAKHDHR
jgi:hypothetical protein